VNIKYSLAIVALWACQSPPTSRSTEATASARGPRPAEVLDELDSRQPVPLLPMMAQHQKQNMRDHLSAVQEVVSALGAGDFAKVATSAKRIGYSDTMGRMCEHMGAAAPGFTQQALAFHHTADEIVVAAAKNDAAAVLTALSATLATCTTCHAAYKQKLVDELPD
jgi:hypothetical protein